jgi:hypothetical protein
MAAVEVVHEFFAVLDEMQIVHQAAFVPGVLD